MRREYSEKIFEKVVDNKFSDIWLDLRILLFSKYLEKYNVIEENLTFYRQFEGKNLQNSKNLVNLGGKEESCT